MELGLVRVRVRAGGGVGVRVGGGVRVRVRVSTLFAAPQHSPLVTAQILPVPDHLAIV